jgi:NAD(P)H-nitrite reductase large subunit
MIDVNESAMGKRQEPELTFACRCEEVLNAEIAAALASGAHTIDDVKRRTRAGMGACQGIYCMPAIAALVATASGAPIATIAPMTARPPVRPISLAALAGLGQFDVF